MYHRLGDALTAQGIDLWALDQIGHGLSDGDRAVIQSIDDLVYNARLLTALADAAGPGEPLLLAGHSLGAAAAAVTVSRDPSAYRGLIVSGAPLSPLDWVNELAEGAGELSLDPADLSADPFYLDEIENDPLAFTSAAGAQSLAISAAACVSASLNAAARGLYSLGREDILPRGLGHSHPEFKTPHVAIYVLAPVVGVVPFVMVAYGTAPLSIFGYLGTLATFGYLLAYVLVSIAAPVFLARRRALTPLPVIVAVLATGAIGYVIYKNLVPVPPTPYNVFPYIFLGWIVLGLAWYLAVKLRDQQRAARLGTLAEQEAADLESRIAAELSNPGNPAS